MRRAAAMLGCLALVGCPWIDAAEHADNQRVFDRVPRGPGSTGATADTGPVIGDTDVDTDIDTDTDVDTDVDTDTDVDCTDDPFEPNDDAAEATFLTTGTEVSAVLCPEGAPTGYVDVFELVPGPGNVVDIALGAGATACNEMDLRVEVRGDDDELRDWARGDGNCPSFRSGGYGDGLVRAYVVHEGSAPLDYTLSLTAAACTQDADSDGFLASACGGPDCNDADDDIYPGAPETPADGIDSDCDLGDVLAECAVVPPSLPTEAAGSLACDPEVTGHAWDAWTISAPAGACVAVAVDNLGVPSDPFAVIVGPTGDRLRGDNEEDCSVSPWTRALVFPFDQGCPSFGGTSSTAGVHTIWVAQVDDPDGVNCPVDAPYGLTVWVDGAEVTPTLVGDDVVFNP